MGGLLGYSRHTASYMNLASVRLPTRLPVAVRGRCVGARAPSGPRQLFLRAQAQNWQRDENHG